jgi:hypothetical protein
MGVYGGKGVRMEAVESCCRELPEEQQCCHRGMHCDEAWCTCRGHCLA